MRGTSLGLRISARDADALAPAPANVTGSTKSGRLRSEIMLLQLDMMESRGIPFLGEQ